jgi:MFS transporter, DHA2 family, multidrug resistance protein
LPPEQVKNASGLFNVVRNLGGALGIALTNTILLDENKRHFSIFAEHYTAANEVTNAAFEKLQALASGLGPDPEMARLGTFELLGRYLHREAGTLAFSDALMFIASFFAIALLLVPLLRKPVRNTAPMDAH